MRRPKFTGSILILLVLFFLGIFAIYNLPPVQERLDWRFAELFARFKYALSPPEQIVFVPDEESMLLTQTVSPRSSPPVSVSVTGTQIPPTKQSAASPINELTPIPKNINRRRG